MPGVTEKMCFGTPAFYMNKKIFTRIKEDGETLVIHTLQRDYWISTDPTFFITEHYRNYDYMLISLKTVKPEILTQLLLAAWHNRASKKLITELELLNFNPGFKRQL